MIIETGESIKVNRTQGCWGTLKEVTARKSWTCRICGKLIASGETHYKQTWHTVPGDVRSYKKTRAHVDCYHTGDAVKRAESLFVQNINLVLKEKDGQWWLADENEKYPVWEHLHYPDVLNWIAPESLPDYVNGDPDPTIRYYDAIAKVETVRMMQDPVAHQDFLRQYEVPSQERALAQEKEHSGAISFERYRLKKLQDEMACPMGSGEKVGNTRPDAQDISRHSATLQQNVVGDYECPTCHYTISQRLVNFN